jgi:hypothetical protein
MSVWGEILIECDSKDCRAQHAVTGDDAFRVAGREYAEDEGWIEVDGRHVCPQCQAEANPRERGDDDGVEYGHPDEARDERL